jgi:methyl-accepting chemotaxis protein
MLAVPTAAIILMTLLLVAVLAAGSLRSWRRGEDAMARLEQLRQLLLLQEMIGLERAPSNSLLSLHGPAPPVLQAAFVTARRATDERLGKLAAQPAPAKALRYLLPTFTPRLIAARAVVDTVLERPVDQRTADEIEVAIKALLGLSPLLFSAIEDELAEIGADDPEVAPLLTAMHAAADLRLYAGTMVGRFAAALTERRPFTPAETTPIHVQQGQMIELHRLLLANIRIAGVVEPMRAAIDAMEQHVFVDAWALYDRVITSGISDGRFDLSHATVVDQYMPALNVLVQVRDTLIELSRQRLRADQQGRLHALETTLAAGGAVMLAVLAALTMLHWRVIRPLSALAAMVIRLARGDRSVRLPVRHGSREIVELARAIEVLRVATLAADAAAERRRGELQRWTDQVQGVLATLDQLHDRTMTMTTLLPTLLGQLDALVAQGDVPGGAPASGLADAIAATRAGIDVVHGAADRLDLALRRMHAVGEGQGGRIEDLRGAMEEVAQVVAAIEASVNRLPQMTLSAMQALPRPMARGRGMTALDGILAQVQEMAATAGGLQTSLLQANHGMGELARLRA